MADYNLVVIVGRLGHDPHLDYTLTDGIPFCDLTLDVKRQVPNADGGTSTSEIKVAVNVRGRQAELVCQFLKKGGTCLVTGYLELHGTAEMHPALRIRAERIQFMDQKPATAERKGE